VTELWDLALRRTVLALVRERYADFGPTLAAGRLAGCHGVRVGVETLRQWMMADGLWIERKARVRFCDRPGEGMTLRDTMFFG
jgi:hypothetical protein